MITGEPIPLHLLANHCPPGSWSSLAREWVKAWETWRVTVKSFRPMREVIGDHYDLALTICPSHVAAAKLLKISRPTLIRHARKSKPARG